MHRKTQWKDSPTVEVLRQLYWEEQLSVAKIGYRLNVPMNAVFWRMKRLGIPRRSVSEAVKLAIKQGRPPGYKWRHIGKRGHVRVTDEAGKSGYRYEHTVVWEHTHSRPLPRGWVIHHLNGVPYDNRPENLVAYPQAKHSLVIPTLKKRIRQLEVENVRLRKSLEQRQSMPLCK